MYIIYKK